MEVAAEPHHPPAAGVVLAGLAGSYSNLDLGKVRIVRDDKGARLFASPWNTAIVTRRNEDGSVSLIASEPELVRAEFTVGTKDGKRSLTLHDGQHVYVFTEDAA
jgi:hypothetical protein